KLVYDNYNKFITATETIKEMKRDVYAMDADMEAVRLKMRQIAQGSGVLDLVLQPTRSKVDKLVRVRRLLQRLEFLNELPARLETMIRHKRYTEAVHLYKKTISVLTRHSHVLSFKKIKERTEVMMTELTHQVIDLLEDPSLEAVKLTQYISVLRLMGAPAEKGMITSFNQSLLTQQALREPPSPPSPTPTAPTDATSPAVVKDIKSQEIVSARQFHQSVVVGLIEACKGELELYGSPLPPTPRRVSGGVGGVGAEEEAGEMEGGQEGGQGREGGQEGEERQRQAAAAYTALAVVVHTVVEEYSASLIKAFSMFFTRYQSLYLQRRIDYCDISELPGE
ncbi:hypothetical protein B484DRAFT_389347, partial [Ochromonadaceae sp. CCMP2298]